MSYDIAINQAWESLKKISSVNKFTVRFFNDNYDIDIENRRILSLSCNAPAKDYTSILILHYLKQKLIGLVPLTGEWISFKEFPESLGYYPAFEKRVIEPILRKYGSNPQAVLQDIERLGARHAQQGDVGLVIEAFPEVPMLVILWKADDEFGPEAGVLFDKSILKMFCVEDIIVLAEFVARAI